MNELYFLTTAQEGYSYPRSTFRTSWYEDLSLHHFFWTTFILAIFSQFAPVLLSSSFRLTFHSTIFSLKDFLSVIFTFVILTVSRYSVILGMQFIISALLRFSLISTIYLLVWWKWFHYFDVPVLLKTMFLLFKIYLWVYSFSLAFLIL